MVDNGKTEVPFATLDDLTSATLDVTVELEDGRLVRMLLKTLSAFRIAAIQNSIPLPSPVLMYPDKEGRPVYDWNDAEYIRTRDNILIKRNLLTLAHMIQTPAIPGETDNEKLQWMQDKFSPAVQDQLLRLVKIVTSKGEARIYSRAETFQPDGTADNEGLPANGVDVPAVA